MRESSALRSKATPRGRTGDELVGLAVEFIERFERRRRLEVATQTIEALVKGPAILQPVERQPLGQVDVAHLEGFGFRRVAGLKGIAMHSQKVATEVAGSQTGARGGRYANVGRHPSLTFAGDRRGDRADSGEGAVSTRRLAMIASENIVRRIVMRTNVVLERAYERTSTIESWWRSLRNVSPMRVRTRSKTRPACGGAGAFYDFTYLARSDQLGKRLSVRQDGDGAALVVWVSSIERHAELIVDRCENVVDVHRALDGLRTERVACSDHLP